MTMHWLQRCEICTHPLLIGGLAFLLTGLGLAFGDDIKRSWRSHVQYEFAQTYDPNRSPESDFTAALQYAKASQRQVMVIFGGEWCNWCHIFARYLAEQPAVKRQLTQNFVLVKVYSGEGEPNAQFMQRCGQVIGLPYFCVFDARGNLLASKSSAVFWQGDHYDSERLLRFFRHPVR